MANYWLSKHTRAEKIRVDVLGVVAVTAVAVGLAFKFLAH